MKPNNSKILVSGLVEDQWTKVAKLIFDHSLRAIGSEATSYQL